MVTDRARKGQSYRQILEKALIKIIKGWTLLWINAADYKKLGRIEGCAHELAHALDLGRIFEDLLQTMSAEKSNKHEASVLRIEVAAPATLGVHLSMRRLRASANWNGSIGVPSLAQSQAALNQHEQNCVDRFKALVTHEIRDMTSPKHLRSQT